MNPPAHVNRARLVGYLRGIGSLSPAMAAIVERRERCRGL